MEVFYNVTLTVDPKIENEWRNFMLEVHLPDVVRQPGFKSVTMQKVELLPPAAAPTTADRPSYVMSYTVESREALEAYLNSAEAIRLREEHKKRYSQYTTATRAVWAPVRTLKP